MNRRLLLTALIVLSAGSLFARDAATLHRLQSQVHVQGEGCWLQLPKSPQYDADVFQWNFADEAWINLGESDLRLHLVSRRHPATKNGEDDKIEIVEFSGPDVRVVVTTTITKDCPPDDESCEAWLVVATIDVTSAGKTFTTRTKGLCGS